MNKSKELLSIRYISIIVLFMEIFINNNDIKYIGIIFVLLLTLNNHLRIYYIKNQMVMIISLVLEIIAIGIAYSFFGGNIIFYLIRNNYRYLYNRRKIFKVWDFRISFYRGCN